MNKYKGTFNLKGELFTLYTTVNTTNEARVFNNFVRQLSKKVKISPFHLKRIFYGRDNYFIKLMEGDK